MKRPNGYGQLECDEKEAPSERDHFIEWLFMLIAGCWASIMGNIKFE